ncbi:MAG TPA: hypothetical protein VFW88_06930 [Burkholderiales bacterium]|nr:hypothetical protein [Burkholderiales bacterium]
MSARGISILAYREHLASGKALKQWERILLAVEKHGPLTRAEIERWTAIRLSSVCGRVKELLDVHVLAEVGIVKCKVTHNRVHALMLSRAEPRVQPSLFEGIAA